jgi:hypothetical protein
VFGVVTLLHQEVELQQRAKSVPAKLPGAAVAKGLRLGITIEVCMSGLGIKSTMIQC